MKNSFFLIWLVAFGCVSLTAQHVIDDANGDNLNTQSSVEHQSQQGMRVYQPVPPQAMPVWLTKSSLSKAPVVIRGMLNYFNELYPTVLIPSYHRLILVGPPGVGKTTLARSIATHLRCSYYLKDASTLIGRFRNETAENIRGFFHTIFKETDPQEKIVVIIDEMHKLVENYLDNRSDDSMTAGALWLMLDVIEERYPNVIIIATMNSASSLPPEMISRFSGRIVGIEKPDRPEMVDALFSYLENDPSIVWNHLTYEVDTFDSICSKISHFSMRDMKCLIDAAKMYSIANLNITQDNKIILSKESFDQAFEQLKKESKTTSKSLIEKHYSSMKRWHLATGLALNAYAIYRIGGSAFSYLKYRLLPNY